MFIIYLAIHSILLSYPANRSVEHFPKIEGLQKSGEIEIYNENTLFDYINGAAESYLNYEFVELKLQRYSGPDDGSLRIEIYEHASVANAFGIYSTERPEKGNWIDVGGQGYHEEDILNFYKGHFYIKLMTYNIKNSEEILEHTANVLENLLPSNNDTIEIFNLFPEEGRQLNSERYINKNYLGYESLSEAYTVNYRIDKDQFDLFIIKKDNALSIKRMLNNYYNSIKLDINELRQGKILVNDPYQGEYHIIWIDEFIIGTVNFNNENVALKLMDMIKKKIN